MRTSRFASGNLAEEAREERRRDGGDFPDDDKYFCDKKRTDISAIKKTQKNFFCDEKIKKAQIFLRSTDTRSANAANHCVMICKKRFSFRSTANRPGCWFLFAGFVRNFEYKFPFFKTFSRLFRDFFLALLLRMTYSGQIQALKYLARCK